MNGQPTPLSDEVLAAQLRRRAEAQPLLGHRREDLVQQIVAGVAAHPARAARWSLPRRWLVPALAGGVLVLVLLALAGQLPRQSDPVNLAPGGPPDHVLTPAELAELREARATGLVVADISAAHVGRSMTECRGRTPCLLIVLDGVAPIVDFAIIGVEEIDTSRPTVLALLDGEIEYIGPVEIKPGGFAWSVSDLAAMDEPADELHVVDGWLVQSAPHPCPAPPNVGVATPTPEPGTPVMAPLDYWCPASWLTAERATLETITHPRDDHVQVQTGAYGEYADAPIYYGPSDVPEPKRGQYLVGPAGCPEAAWSGRCPVWQMIGRLHAAADDGTPTTPRPEPPPPTATPAPGAASGQADIFGAVAQWLPTAEVGLPDKPLYVDDAVEQVGWFDSERHTELEAAGPPLFGAALTADSEAAITGALSERREPLFVPDRQSVVDPDAYEHFGCRPYLGSRAVLRLGAPRQVSEDVFLVEVNLDLGCAGRRYLLEVSLTADGYRVTDVLARGDWIV